MGASLRFLPGKGSPQEPVSAGKSPKCCPGLGRAASAPLLPCLFGVGPSEAKLGCQWVQCWCHTRVTRPGTKAATAEDWPPAGDGRRIKWASSLDFWGLLVLEDTAAGGGAAQAALPTFLLHPLWFGM